MHRSICLISGLLLCGAVMADELNPVFINGGFEMLDRSSLPDFWQVSGETSAISVQREGGNHFLRIDRANREQITIVYQHAKVDESWKGVTLSARMRARNLMRGRERYMTGRIELIWNDSESKETGERIIIELKDNQDWKDVSANGTMPEKAVSYSVTCGMWNCAGVVDFDDVKIAPTPRPGSR